MKASKRIAAAVLAVCMVAGTMGMQVQAYEENGIQFEKTEEESIEESKIEEPEGQENPAEPEGIGDQENPAEPEGIGDQERPEEAGGLEKPESQKKAEELDGQEQAENPEQGTLNFIMQESDSITTPGVQNVAVSLGEEGSAVESAQLSYQNTTTGQEFTVKAAGIVDNMARFSMEYNSESQAGIYELLSIAWTQNGKNYETVLSQTDAKVVYGVNRETQAEPDEVLLDQELLEAVEANVVTMDGNGNAISENTLEDVLEQEGDRRFFSSRSMVRGAQKMVIILDPGHDSTHSGASYHGYREQDLTLKIAQYCKEELEKYSGISIYMTRETQACPNGGSIVDSGTCNAKRVELAAAKKADVYVSFHLNASVSSTPKGVGVYYPNSNYRPEIGAEGKGLATEIYEKLKALGLSTWATGILIRNSETNTQYPDGSLADYLAIIRRSKLAGFPAVLIEHAFLSNAGDVNSFLNSEAKLKNLGVADAKGIADYYKLTLAGDGTDPGGNGGDGNGGQNQPTGQPPVISSVQSRGSGLLRVCWNQVPDASFYRIYRSNSENGAYVQVAAGSGIQFDDKNVSPGATYYYKVCTVYGEGKTSVQSAAHAGKTLVKPQVTKVVSKSSSQIQITWNGMGDASKYEIYRSTKSGSGYQKIATVKAGKTSYIDKKATPQTTYYYKIRTRGGEKNGYSSYSKAVSGWAVKKTKIVSVSSKTKTSLVIKWNKISKAYGYRVKRSTSKTKGYKTVATIKSGTTTSYVDKKLKTGKKYYYKIQVLNRVNKKTGYSDDSKAASGATITGTAMVSVRSKDSKSMEVKWKKDTKATGYRLKRSETKNGKYQTVVEIQGNSTVKYIDKTIASGKVYYYAVESVAEKNGVKNYSGNSKPVSARNLKKVTVSSLETGEKGVSLSWKKVAGANGYQIMRSDAKNGKFTEIAKLSGDKLSYQDTQTAIGNRYYYKIRAFASGKNTGYGSYTAVLEKWALEAPQDFAAVLVQADQVRLSWEAARKAVGYEIFRSNQADGKYGSIATIEGRKNVTYMDNTVLADNTYYYKVAAIGKYEEETGNGDATDPVSVQVGY